MRTRARVLLTWFAAIVCVAGTAFALLAKRTESRINLGRDLVAAVRRRDENAVTRLLRSGADPDTLDDWHEEHVGLPTGANTAWLELRDRCSRMPRGDSVLTVAVTLRCPAIVEALLNDGADVNRIDFNGLSALGRAALSGMAPRNLIIDHESSRRAPGADVVPEVRQLLDHGARMTLIDAAFLEDEASARSALERNPSADACGCSGVTPLAVASGYGDREFARLAIERGADVDRADIRGLTPLMFAVGHGDADIVRMLLAHGADAKHVDKIGRSAAHWVTVSRQGNHAELFGLLAAAGADLDVKDRTRTTPLMLEALRGGEGLRYLLEHGADPTSLNSRGNSALTIAATFEDGRADLVRKYRDRVEVSAK